jgi:hypothetical protein
MNTHTKPVGKRREYKTLQEVVYVELILLGMLGSAKSVSSIVLIPVVYSVMQGLLMHPWQRSQRRLRKNLLIGLEDEY